MSIAAACPACLNGNHARHDRDWNIMPERLGGAHCPCTGDCAKFTDPALRMIRLSKPETPR